MMIFIKGASITAGLITSLGPQNIEIIRLGLLRQKAVVMASVFILCDIILVLMGALGIGELIASHKWLLLAGNYIAVVMLYYLAYQAIRRMYKPLRITINHSFDNKHLLKTIKRGLFLSFFNPLVLLETVIVVGGASAQYPLAQRMYFIGGAISASFVWFYSLALCTTKISTLFTIPSRQRALEGIICLILSTMATIILYHTF
jgi:L-lysine exporter family protein LysE/ArgO